MTRDPVRAAVLAERRRVRATLNRCAQWHATEFRPSCRDAVTWALTQLVEQWAEADRKRKRGK